MSYIESAMNFIRQDRGAFSSDDQKQKYLRLSEAIESLTRRAQATRSNPVSQLPAIIEVLTKAIAPIRPKSGRRDSSARASVQELTPTNYR